MGKRRCDLEGGDGVVSTKKLVPYDGGEAGWESGAWAGPTACQSPATRLDGTAVRKEKIVCGATWLGTVTRSS